MSTENKTWGWELARNSDLLVKIFGGYPSFHDSAVTTFSLQRKRRSFEGVDSKPLPAGRVRYLLDLQLEVLHNRYAAPRADGGPDYLVVLDLLDIRVSEIDVNAMLEEASVMEISLSDLPDDLIRFDLEPDIGLDIRLTCKEIVVSAVRPYIRSDF
ncbi:immunity 50 family protein [Paraburkholderia sp. MMS20-SJTN17]|uniref:Immunity 50 family protein n=1 Tax=Paraburkholderia translucens TaxID=2886945 RepID=A0ABS8KI40_9BURK|nr:Imm50 family immunity protein [Paraburkholderia sp. MMS20-SJTN17]MCC8404372.1 immunity 50 family protein [Paraburkholderia sp. MMS20-SJTN17]